MAHPTQARGSDKLLAGLIKKGRKATAQDVKAALALDTAGEISLLRWNPRGIPPALLEVEATVQTPVANLGNVVNHLAQSGSLRGIHILVNGIPIPDIAVLTATVEAEAGQ
jgi:hypothetical protein